MKYNGCDYTEKILLETFKYHMYDGQYEKEKEIYEKQSSKVQSEWSDFAEPVCDKFFDTDEYASGDKTYLGYAMCCDILGFCGVSGWIIFLIIVLVLGALAGGAAAFYFFYWKKR